jgi:hypothetical protein
VIIPVTVGHFFAAMAFLILITPKTIRPRPMMDAINTRGNSAFNDEFAIRFSIKQVKAFYSRVGSSPR